jgi:hypothetical protein
LAELQKETARSRQLLAESRRLLARSAAAAPPEATPPRRKRPKRNKLSFKNRWLVAADVFAALRRAGVACDIIVPDPDDRALSSTLDQSPPEGSALH